MTDDDLGGGRDDERLLADLRDALRAADSVPASFLAAGKAAFAWRTVDAELAALTASSTAGSAANSAAGSGAGEPSLDPALAGTRAEPAALRALTFVASGLTIEVEVTTDALVGQVVPPQEGRIEVHRRDGAGPAVPVDEVGWFAIRPVPEAMFRLHLRTADGAAVVTEWVTL